MVFYSKEQELLSQQANGKTYSSNNALVILVSQNA